MSMKWQRAHVTGLFSPTDPLFALQQGNSLNRNVFLADSQGPISPIWKKIKVKRGPLSLSR